MKTTRTLLAGILVATTACAAIADGIPALDSHWHRMAKTADYQTFYGMSATISEAPYVGSMWNKVDFTKPQASGYQTAVLLVRVDCTNHRTAIERMVKYSDKKTQLSDVSTAEAQFKWVDAKGTSPTSPEDLAFFGIGRMDWEAACDKGE